jgi:hypothetical protein
MICDQLLGCGVTLRGSKRRLGAEADQPHRIKYRKLVRA